jgi:hypothetical protein
MGFIILFIIAVIIIRAILRGTNNKSRMRYIIPGKDVQALSRRDYYRDVYLKSDEWKRKRYVVLKRDNWRCVRCGAPATQVHHKKYAPINIGKEPIEWLESVCKRCHDSIHNK